MDQDDTLDFKALRAKFQDEEVLLKQPKIKPALPEKPKVVPPPQSPTYYLPAGARPSLLTSINQSLEGKTVLAPRVVFKDEKKESKKPLILSNSKGKDKSEGKLKGGKDKTTKGSKEKAEEDSMDLKHKKENGKKLPLIPVLQKEGTAELVPASPPPKATTTKKKGLLGFKKSSKRDSVEVPADPILDTPSSDVPGAAPLIPVPFGNAPLEPEIPAPELVLPDIPTSPDSSAAVEIAPPFIIPEPPEFTPPPVFIPDIPPPEIPAPQIETPTEIENPALPVSRPASQIEIIPSPPVTAPSPPPSFAITTPPPPVVSAPSPTPPEPEITPEAALEADNIAAVEAPPAPVIDPPDVTPSPKAERPISALSALSRAEDMSPPKRTSPADQRILNALEKARRKSHMINPTRSYSITPPPEDAPHSPTVALPELPPIDYEAGRSGQVNGLDHRQASPALEGITEEGPDPLPELLVVPPPPKKALSNPEPLGPVADKPATRPPSVSLSELLPPHVEDNGIPSPPEFSETDTTDIPEFDDVTSDTHSPEVPVSDWGHKEYVGPDVHDGQNLPEFYGNGIIVPGSGIHTAVGDHQDNPPPDTSINVSQDSLPVAENQEQQGNGVYESTDNVYEDITSSGGKKKGKTDGGKKRKGPPKNPYAEPGQEPNQEKTKPGRFTKSDKKAAAEGPDEKELKKKEKQRLEKEKKEQKEKQEREKKEQKEREKKENELKKKFKITGQEDAMYQAKVTVTTKGRKNDLPVNSGDNVSIIRTTNCPKGKWLARDSSNNYGYVAVDHVELDIKEMLELGKKAARKTSSNVTEEVTSTGSRASNHYPVTAESFTDDSEEWTGDDEETLSPTSGTPDPLAPVGHIRALSMPDMANKDLNINHQHSHSDINPDGTHVQAKHEALQKLATFFHSPKPAEPTASSTAPETSPVLQTVKAVHAPEANSIQEIDFEQPDSFILPPPDLYADLTTE